MSAVTLEAIEQVDSSSILKPEVSQIVYALTTRNLSNDDGAEAIFDYINASATKEDLVAILTEINSVILEVKAGNVAQNESISTEVNARLTAIANNLVLLNDSLAQTQTDVANLDDIFSTDAAREELRAALELVAQQLQDVDTNVIATINHNVSVMAQRDVTWQKVCSVASSNGQYSFVYADEIAKVFDSATEVVVSAQVKGSAKAYAYVTGWDANGATIQVETKGTHMIPVPKDCAVQNVEVTVTITHKQKNLLQGVDIGAGEGDAGSEEAGV
jgi:hypothetical protein